MAQALSVDFGLNIDWNSFNSAVSSVNKLDREVSKFIAGAEKIATVFAAGGVASGIFEWAKSAVDKYAEMEKATTAFSHAMNNLGITSKSAIRDYIEYAEALSRGSMATKEDILETERLLTTFGLSGESLKKATKAALDLSAGLGVDLRTATMMLGKAFDGNTTSLSKLGIKIDENTPKSQIFAEVMRQVEERFGGSASAQMDTYAGKLNLLHKQFNEITETFGRAFMPVAVNVLNWFRDLGTVLEWLLPKLGMYQNEDQKLQAHLERELKIAQSFLDRWEKILKDREGKGGWLSRLLVGHGEEGINEAKAAVAKYTAEIDKLKAQIASIGKSTGGSTVPKRTTGAVDTPKADTSGDDAAWKRYVAAAKQAYAMTDAMAKSSEEFQKLLLTEEGQNYLAYYGANNLLDREFAAQQGASAKEVQRNTQLELAKLKADYAAAGKTISGGWKQALIEMRNAGVNWKAQFTGLIDSVANGFGNAVAQMVTEQKTLGEVMSALWKQVVSEIISQLVAMGVRMGILRITESTGATAAQAEITGAYSVGAVTRVATSKAAAVSEINAYAAVAAAAAYAANVGIPIVGPAVAAGYATEAEASVLAFLAQLGFRKGGYTGDGNDSDVAGVVHKKEYVLDADKTSALMSGGTVTVGDGAGALAGASAGGANFNISVSPTINITGAINAGTDVTDMLKQITSACKDGTADAISAAKALYKTGAKHDGQTGL